jgi:hypothetical protein|tara:strand:+ start:503 stop:3205 length:2703 start_codon:yes stop_codon:yes gene_type:complete
MSNIKLEYIDETLISGSTDRLRSTLNKSWEFVEGDSGDVYEFDGSADEEDNIYISKIESNLNLAGSNTGSAIINSYTFPIRIYGDGDEIDSTETWKAFLYGGTAVSKTFQGIYSTDIYSDNHISLEAPYTNIERLIMNSIDGSDYESIVAQPSYNYFLPAYQSYTDSLNQRALANIYDFISIASAESAGLTDQININVHNYITKEGEFAAYMGIGEDATVADLLTATEMSPSDALPPEESLYYGVDIDGDGTSDTFYDRNKNLRNYLSGAFVALNVSSSTSIAVRNRCKNFIFDTEGVDTFLKPSSDIISLRDLFPCYVNIEIPTTHTVDTSKFPDTNIFRSLISDNDCEQILLAQLAVDFNSEEGQQSRSLSYRINKTFSSGSLDNNTISEASITRADNFRYRSLLGMATRAANSNLTTDSKNTDYHFVGGDTLIRKAALSNLLSHRFIKSIRITKLVNDLTTYINDTAPFDIEGSDDSKALQNIHDFAQDTKYYETIAYRIEKVNLAGLLISNYWIYNVDGLESITLTDTQVKYNDEYTYRIYAYKIVHGINYSYSDIAAAEAISVDDDTGIITVQFNDSAGNSTSQLFVDADDNEFLDENEFATNSQTTVDESTDGATRYMADLNVNYEPTIKILEVPLISKTIRVLDHPSTTIDVIPYYKLDDSNTIGFKLIKEAFATREMPQAFNTAENNYINDYKTSYDLLPTDTVSDNAKAPVNYVEAYRLEEKPSAYISFSAKLLKKYNLGIANESSTLAATRCEDRILTNQKYYYVFRSVTRLQHPGQFSEIYECELINDGGYKYAKFETLFESDLAPSKITTTSKSFKKLIQLIPNSSHMKLVTDDVDYTQPAATQLENLQIGDSDLIDPIWGKTFKIRLTSKKTGKKIDLNITYNLESG